MQPGFSLNMSFGQQYNSNYDHWMFVHYRDIDRNDIHNYYVSANDRNRIVQNSVVIRNTYVDNSRHTTYVTGPSRTDLQRNTGRKIVPIRIRENNKPGSDMNNGQLRIYRPQVERSNNNNRKPTPARVTKSNDVKQRPSVNEINQNRIGNTDKQPDVVSPQNNTQAVEQRNVNQQNNRESDQ